MPNEVKGFVLAAGFGTRLKPITTLYPKPLIPFLGKTPLQIALTQLKNAGIEQLAVNTHYLNEKVAAYLDQQNFGQVQLSNETEILGTGGAYNPIRNWIGNATLVVINGDVVTNIDLSSIVQEHQRSGATATMVLLPEVVPGESGVYHEDGRVFGIGKYGKNAKKCGNFACIQILEPEFFSHLPSTGSFDVISTGYKALLDQGKPIGAVIYDGIWHDIRTPSFYYQALLDTLSKIRTPELKSLRDILDIKDENLRVNGSFISSMATIATNAIIGSGSIVESGVTLSSGSSIREAVILPGQVILEGSVCEKKVVGPGIEVSLSA